MRILFIVGGALAAHKKRFSLLVLPVLASFLITAPTWLADFTWQVAHAQAQTATVRVMPALIQINPGQTAELAIEVVDVQNLYGFDLQLAFNPGVMEVVDANPNQSGVQVIQGDFMDQGFEAVNEVDNTTGTLRFVMTQLNPSQPKSGTGMLVRLQLRGLSGGSTPLTLAFAELVDRDANVLPVLLTPGRVEVAGTPGAPTNTLGPTQAGTTAAPGAQLSPTATGSPQPTQPGGYPEPESPTPPPPGATQEGGYPAVETATFAPMPLPGITRRAPTELQETQPVETAALTATMTATAPAAQPQDTESDPLLETAIILIVILVLALGAIFIFLQLSRGA
jgi:hypothetical protein